MHWELSSLSNTHRTMNIKEPILTEHYRTIQTDKTWQKPSIFLLSGRWCGHGERLVAYELLRWYWWWTSTESWRHAVPECSEANKEASFEPRPASHGLKMSTTQVQQPCLWVWLLFLQWFLMLNGYHWRPPEAMSISVCLNRCLLEFAFYGG